MIQLYVLAGAVAVSFFAGWQVHSWKADAERLDALVASDMKRQSVVRVIDKAAEGHERDKARIRTEFITITQTVEKVIREPFYAAADAPACLDDDGLRQLRTAIGVTEPASKPERAVRGPGSTD